MEIEIADEANVGESHDAVRQNYSGDPMLTIFENIGVQENHHTDLVRKLMDRSPQMAQYFCRALRS